jgi:hypothetical protein
MFQELPIALTSEYTTVEIDESIVLYEGQMGIAQEANSWHGNGVIRFEWLPFSRVAMRFYPAEPSAHIELKPSKLRIRVFDLDSEADVNLTRVPFAFPSASGEPTEGIVRRIDCGQSGGCARLRFHIPNLPLWLGRPVRNQKGGCALKRLSLRHGEWDVTIDAIKFESSEHQELKDSGGHGLTHVGIVVRRDGAPFSLTDCEPLLECISYFLSFCRGAWTCPILLSAEDEAGKVIGRRWASDVVDRYKSTISWVPSTEPVAAVIQSAFEGYADAWFSKVWGDSLRIVTQWYVESSTGDVGKSIILMQAALELLAWVRLVEDKKILTKKDWRIPFSSKLRILLSQTSIPLLIPPNLSGLSTYCSTDQVLDGPEGITSIRNALVHPSPAKRARLKTHPRALTDTWILALWYLDLCILNACGYKGRYSNRIAPATWTGDEIEAVPWD